MTIETQCVGGPCCGETVRWRGVIRYYVGAQDQIAVRGEPTHCYLLTRDPVRGWRWVWRPVSPVTKRARA